MTSIDSEQITDLQKNTLYNNWKLKAFEVESLLKQIPKNILFTYTRKDELQKIDNLSNKTCHLNTLFVLKWNKEQFYGPNTMLIRYVDKRSCWVIETYQYFTPSENDIKIHKQRINSMSEWWVDNLNIMWHNTIDEFISDMKLENEKRDFTLIR